MDSEVKKSCLTCRYYRKAGKMSQYKFWCMYDHEVNDGYYSIFLKVFKSSNSGEFYMPCKGNNYESKFQLFQMENGMKYWIDIKFKDGTCNYYRYDDIEDDGRHIKLYKVEGLVFKKRTLINKIWKGNIEKVKTGKVKK